MNARLIPVRTGEPVKTSSIPSAAIAPGHGTKESFAKLEKPSASFPSRVKMVANVRICQMATTLVVAYRVIAEGYARRTSMIVSPIRARMVESALIL